MAGTEYIRCVRERQNWDDKGERVVRVESVPEAVEYLQNTTGNVLIATGSKELKEYTRIAGCKERCYAVSFLHRFQWKRAFGLDSKESI